MPFDLDRYRRRFAGGHVGAAVRYRESTDSTMNDARAGAAEDGGDDCGTAYVAGEQTAGRGRQGRSWVSAAASGLYVTYHLCPRSAERAPLLSIAGALATADAIEAAAGLRVDVKWPNDLLHEGRKLCGILAEARQTSGRVDVLLGIGVNLRTAPSLPPEVAALATSVEQAGAAPPAPEDLLAELSNALGRRAAQADDDPETLVADWRARLVTLGRRVRFEAPSGAVEGEAVDVTARGELVLRLADGSTQAFAAGDVHGIA
jgi:BirA family biotin operon repressor/biotin-[acetyl-CoA-carboxylase] ligase